MPTEPIEGAFTLTGESTWNHATVFGFNGVEILRLDEKGMTYKGVLIEDAGEAHRAFIEAMNRTNLPMP